MKTPFELPVRKPKHHDYLGNYMVLDAKARVIVRDLTSDEADYIVHAINSHERLERALKRTLGAMSCDELNNGHVFDDDLRKEVKEEAKQALKETENPK